MGVMRLKSRLKLRRMGAQYMVVDAMPQCDHLSQVFTLNGVAARIWQLAEGREFTAESVAASIAGEYDIDADTALADVRAQLAEWQQYGLVEA